jgi:hypothetical protein
MRMQLCQTKFMLPRSMSQTLRNLLHRHQSQVNFGLMWIRHWTPLQSSSCLWLRPWANAILLFFQMTASFEHCCMEQSQPSFASFGSKWSVSLLRQSRMENMSMMRARLSQLNISWKPLALCSPWQSVLSDVTFVHSNVMEGA